MSLVTFLVVRLLSQEHRFIPAPVASAFSVLRYARIKHFPAQGLERFTNLVTLSLGCVNLTSLTNFPQLPKLQNLLLSDNKIAGGLEALTAAKLDQLTELDLSNNKLASLPVFKPLAGLRSLKALHVEANPAEHTVADLRQALFNMMATLQYVDNEDRFGKGRSASLRCHGYSPVLFLA